MRCSKSRPTWHKMIVGQDDSGSLTDWAAIDVVDITLPDIGGQEDESPHIYGFGQHGYSRLTPFPKQFAKDLLEQGRKILAG